MRNDKFIVNGLGLIIEGLIEIQNYFKQEDVSSSCDVTLVAEKELEDSVEEKKSEEIKVEEVAVEKAPVEEEKIMEEDNTKNGEALPNYTEEELKKLKYNEFKTYAAKLGVKCTGSRQEIMNRIMDLKKSSSFSSSMPKPIESEEIKVEEVAVEKAPVEEEKSSRFKKFGKVLKDNIEDEFTVKAKELISNLSVEEVISYLKENDIEANKHNVAGVLAQCLRDGTLDIEDDEDSDEISEYLRDDCYFADFDPYGYNDPDLLSENRKKAISEKVSSILDTYNSGKLSVESMTQFLKSNFNEDEDETITKLCKDDFSTLKAYIEFIKRFIDDEGIFNENGEPYEIQGVPFCCGHELTYLDDEDIFVCDFCNNEYEG